MANSNYSFMDSSYPIDGHCMNKELVKIVQDCEATCEHMTRHLDMAQHYEPARERQAILLRDCADICTITAKYLARGSMFSRCIALLCADICDACGAECARFPDEMSQNCAQVCFHCARACRSFVGMYR